MKSKKFSLRSRLKSFEFAFNGIHTLIKEEHNSRIHIFMATCACICGLVLKLRNSEWIFIILAIGFVLVSEIFNSMIENLADLITAQKHPTIKKVKDLAAAMVLISAITALVIGAIIFIPKILQLC